MATASSRAGKRFPRLHLITDDAVVGSPDFVPLAADLLRAGGPVVALHLRAHSTAARRLFRCAERLLPEAEAAGALLLVNDRVDVALGSGAHGVQLGERSMPLADARRLLGEGRLLGASVHSLGAGEAAVRAGADFLLAGTLYGTPSHPGRAGSGTAWLGALARGGVPVVGIGGITPARAGGVLAAGGHGVAVLRGVWLAEDPIEMLRAFLVELSGEHER